MVIAGEEGTCPPASGVAGWGGSAVTAALSQSQGLAVRYHSGTGGCLSVLFPADNVELPAQIRAPGAHSSRRRPPPDGDELLLP